jgi:hypothetical protein
MALKKVMWGGLLIGALASFPALAKDPRQKADYFVPTNDTTLEAFTHTQVTVKWKSLAPGHRIFSYDLPRELDGLGQDILVRETSPNYFVGDHASGVCEYTKIESCKMTYKNLQSNLEAAKAEILSKYADPKEQQGRIELTTRFISDPEPIGIWTAKEPIHSGIRGPEDSARSRNQK